MSPEATPISPSTKETWLHLLLVAGGAALFYTNSFGNFFVWNDCTLIIENFLVKDWRNLPEIFSSAFWKPLIGEPPQIYRPLTLASFVMDFAFWGLKPWGYHFTNILLHVLNSILVYILALKYVPSVPALTASLLFAVHPIHVEAVTYIFGRGELFMAAFLLAGVLLFIRSRQSGSWLSYFVSLLCFFFALLAKETAVIFPLLVLAGDIAVSPHLWRRDLWRQLACHVGPIAVLGGCILWWELFVGKTAMISVSAAPTFAGHLLLTLKAIPVYLGLLLFPWNLHFIHSVNPTSLLEPQVWLSVSILVGAGWGLRRALRSDNRAVSFALLWLLIGLLPVVYFIGHGLPLLEGWIYLPSLGFFLLVSIGFGKLSWGGQSHLQVWAGVLIAAVLGGVTFDRNRDWEDDLQISLHTATALPNNPVALRLLGDARFKRGRTDEAERLYQEAIARTPDDPRLQESLGRINSFLRKDSLALAHYERMRELTRWNPYAYWWIGRYYRRRVDFPSAAKYFSEAARIFPHSSELRNDLATAHYLLGNLDAAESELRSALKMYPHSPMLRRNLEQLLKTKG